MGSCASYIRVVLKPESDVKINGKKDQQLTSVPGIIEYILVIEPTITTNDVPSTTTVPLPDRRPDSRERRPIETRQPSYGVLLTVPTYYPPVATKDSQDN